MTIIQVTNHLLTFLSKVTKRREKISQMIKEINHDIIFLKKKATPASKKDTQTITDLCDTLAHYQDHCVGMAANMIGVNKQIIACYFGPFMTVMLNPQITHKENPYTTTEGCLSLAGQREVKRYEKITVTYLDKNFTRQSQTFSGFFAQTIQHEIDHLHGILI